VDVGCGTGGVGLWLARAAAARLEGFDISPVAVAQATARSDRFVPAGRTAFRVSALDDTGLPDSSVHGAVYVDAIALAAGRTASVVVVELVVCTAGRWSGGCCGGRIATPTCLAALPLTSSCTVGGEASKATTWLRVHICRAEARSAVCW
jgi:SAM-dependent methyltransferase